MKRKTLGTIGRVLCLLGLLAGVGSLVTGCSENTRARMYGGTMEVKLPPGTKLVNATWKEDNFWYLTRPRRTNEPVETHHFQEKSVHGVQEGTVIFHEQ